MALRGDLYLRIKRPDATLQLRAFQMPVESRTQEFGVGLEYVDQPVDRLARVG